MTAYTPNLPIPLGADADGWHNLTDRRSGQVRYLSWSSHDAAGVGVGVEGAQYDDGLVERHIGLYDVEAKELGADDARQLAAALIQAADALDAL
jgi:hypothetical protein